MDRDDLDDTYDLLSPVRGSHGYSDSFESSDEDTKSDERLHSPHDHLDLKSFSLSKSSSLPPPKYASTTRYQSKANNGKHPSASPQPPRKLPARKMSPAKAHDTTKELMKIPQEDNTDLSVWEDWLINKLQVERENNKLQKQAEKQAKQEEERQRREKEHQKRKAEIKHQQWCEEKLLKLKLQKTIEKREKLLKEELKAQEKEEIRRKAEAAYIKWSEKQEEKEQEQKEKEKERKEKEKAEQEEKRRRNEECFQAWVRKVEERGAASPRPKSAGPKEYPSPSYRNPQPWIGPMADKDTRNSVRRQHKHMIAEKHAKIRRNRQRPQTANRPKRKLVQTGPEKGKSVLICRPATATPLFYNVPNRNNKKFMPDVKARGRS